jgi:glycosyltransferase involved in cell wall biosynthesis
MSSSRISTTDPYFTFIYYWNLYRISMRILIASYLDFSVGGGSSVRGRLICEGLRLNGCAVATFTRGAPESIRSEGIVHFQIGGFEQERLKFELTNAVNSFQPDAVLLITEGMLDSVGEVAKELKVPLFVDLHGLTSIEAIEYAAPVSERIRVVRSAIRRELWLRNTQGVISANPKLYDWIHRLVRPCISLVGMADLASLNRNRKIEDDRPNEASISILYSGNRFKYQGVELLLDAIDILVKKYLKHDRYTFIIAGGIGSDIRTDNRISRLTSNDVIIDKGQISHDRMGELIGEADVCVVPRPFTLTNYFAMPQKLIEYMSAGKCIVPTNLAPHRYVIAHNMNGIICNPSALGIAEGLEHTFDGGARERLGMMAHEHAVRHFSHEKQCERLLEFVRQNSTI